MGRDEGREMARERDNVGTERNRVKERVAGHKRQEEARGWWGRDPERANKKGPKS